MIDLHIHSNFSDGTDSIEELVDLVIKNKIDYFSISDHDTVAGVEYLLSHKNLLQKLNENNIKFIKGIEFSSFIDGNEIHILGYNYDEKNSDLLDAIEIGKKLRRKKFEKYMLALKEQKGIELSHENYKELCNLDYVGKPIIANYLVKDGKFKDREAALKVIKQLKVEKTETLVNANIVIPAIKKANGTIVWAHCLGGINDPKISYEEVEKVIQKLLPLGLNGLECFYNLYTKEESEELLKIAKKYNLYVSAGSDYHGKNKDVVIGNVLDKQYFDATNFATILSIL